MPWIVRASIPSSILSTSSLVGPTTFRRSWRRRASPFATGRRVTTTSAASVSSAGPAPQVTPGGAAVHGIWPDRRHLEHPPDVAAVGTAWVRGHRPAAGRLDVDGATPEASDA